MAGQTRQSIVLEFVECINSQDIEALTAMMSEDHEFIDMDSRRFQGRGAMRDGWIGYFKMFPNYRIEVNRLIARVDEIIAVGRSRGTLSEFGRNALTREDGSIPTIEELQGPAIWTARIRDRLVSQWRVYADDNATRAMLNIADEPVS